MTKIRFTFQGKRGLITWRDRNPFNGDAFIRFRYTGFHYSCLPGDLKKSVDAAIADAAV